MKKLIFTFQWQSHVAITFHTITGRAAEFDEPHSLLQNHAGIFYGMVKALGPQEFNRLSQVALDKFNTVRGVDFEEIRL